MEEGGIRGGAAHHSETIANMVAVLSSLRRREHRAPAPAHALRHHHLRTPAAYLGRNRRLGSFGGGAYRRSVTCSGHSRHLLAGAAWRGCHGNAYHLSLRTLNIWTWCA